MSGRGLHASAGGTPFGNVADDHDDDDDVTDGVCVVGAAHCGAVVQFKLSDIGEGIMEVTVKEWSVEGRPTGRLQFSDR